MTSLKRMTSSLGIEPSTPSLVGGGTVNVPKTASQAPTTGVYDCSFGLAVRCGRDKCCKSGLCAVEGIYVTIRLVRCGRNKCYKLGLGEGSLFSRTGKWGKMCVS